ncbi:MAG: cytochrome c3 family protein [Coriobacteriia bacterium]|nr:cytochrome c3 family protein [Coriobacteriia bacterium]
MSDDVKGPAAEVVEAKPAKKKRKTLWIVLAVVLVVLVAAGIAGWKWHESPKFCSTVCHKVMAPYVDSYYNSNFLVRIHAESDVTCLDCHEPTISEQVTEVISYVSGNYKTPLVQRKYSDDMCLKCHISMTELAKNTSELDRNPHEDPHQDDKCSTCHKSHAAQVDYCGKCHDNGGQEMVTYPWTPNGKTTK